MTGLNYVKLVELCKQNQKIIAKIIIVLQPLEISFRYNNQPVMKKFVHDICQPLTPDKYKMYIVPKEKLRH